MDVHYTERFLDSYIGAPAAVQRACDRKAVYLAQNLHHPSLRAKKYDEGSDIWQARATRGWRFYFQIRSNVYWLLDLKPHPK